MPEFTINLTRTRQLVQRATVKVDVADGEQAQTVARALQWGMGVLINGTDCEPKWIPDDETTPWKMDVTVNEPGEK